MKKIEFIVISFLFVFLFFNTYFHLDRISYYGDNTIHNNPPSFIIEKNLVENGEFPLWLPNLKSGMPLANIGNLITNPFLIIFNYLFGAFAAISLSRLAHMLLFFIGFYLLARLVLKDKSAIIVSLSTILTSNVLLSSFGQTWMLYGFSFIPLNIYLLFKAVMSKDYIKYSIMAGMSFGFQILSGGIVHFQYQFFFFLVFALYLLFTKIVLIKKMSKIKINTKNLVKYIKVATVILLVFFLLTGFRLLFFFDWLGHTNRGVGLPLEQIMNTGQKISFDNIIEYFFTSNIRFGLLNIFAHILFIIGFYYSIKNKNSIFKFLGMTYIFYILIAAGFGASFFYDFFPGFKSVRGLDRILSVGIFFGVLVCGYGFREFNQNVISKLNYKHVKLLFKYGTIVLLFALFFSVKGFADLSTSALSRKTVLNSQIENFDLVGKINDSSVFRMHMMEVKGVDNHNINTLALHHDLEFTYGIMAAFWDMRYFHEYMGLMIYKPEMMGMMNVKYFISSDKINLSKFSFLDYVDEFNTKDLEINGRTGRYEENGYLYKHKNSLPRAVVYKNPVLVLGNEEVVKKTSYYLMTKPFFDYTKTAVVFGKSLSISDFSQSELQKFKAVFLLDGSVNSDLDTIKLNKYVENGGNIYPNILEKEFSLSEEKIADVFRNINEDNESLYQQVNIQTYFRDNPNTLVLNNNESGLLYISEKIPLYSGWNLKIDNERVDNKILTVNGVMAGLLVDTDDNKIRLDYEPSFFKPLSYLALVSFIGCVCILSYIFLKKDTSKK